MTAILDEIVAVLNWIWDSVPRPVIYVFFISFIVLIGAVFMPIIFMLTGTFCIQGQEFSGSPLKIWDNPTNMFAVMHLGTNSTNGTTPVSGNIVSDVSEVLNRDCSVKLLYNGEWRYFYTDNNDCVACNTTDDSDPLFGNMSSYNTGFGTVCKDNAYNKDIPWYNEIRCARWIQPCRPPENFYYDYSQNLYVCQDLTICGHYTESQKASTELLSDGYTLVSRVNDTFPTGPRCAANSNRPEMRVFGIPIFDYKVWLGLTLLAIILWIIINFG